MLDLDGVGILRSLLGCGEEAVNPLTLILDFLLPADEFDCELPADRVLVEHTDASEVRRDRPPGPNDELRRACRGEGAFEDFFTVVREDDLRLLRSLACVQSYLLTGSFNKEYASAIFANLSVARLRSSSVVCLSG